MSFRRAPKFLQGGQNGPTLGVAQHHDESCAESICGELDATDLRRRHDVSSNTDDKQVSKALVEYDLCWHPRVRASKNDSERLLACRQLAAAHLARECVAAPNAEHKAMVPFSQAFERFLRGDVQCVVLVRLTLPLTCGGRMSPLKQPRT